MAKTTSRTSRISTASPSPSNTSTDDWTGIRYLLYVTAGWLVATMVAVALLMTVVPQLI